MADEATETNGSSNGTVKKESNLDLLDKAWKERTGGKMPSAKEIATLKGALLKADEKMTAGQKLLEEGKTDFDAASKAALNAFGRKNVKLDNGLVLNPFSSRDSDDVIYRRMGQAESI